MENWFIKHFSMSKDGRDSATLILMKFSHFDRTAMQLPFGESTVKYPLGLATLGFAILGLKPGSFFVHFAMIYLLQRCRKTEFNP